MKAFIIRLDGNSLSEQLADDVFKSALDVNLEPEFFSAINRTNVDEFLDFHNITVAKDKKMREPGTRGCFASHYSLWLKTIELNEPIVILEHDAILLRPVDRILRLTIDVCHLDPYNPYSSSYNNDVSIDNGIGIQDYDQTRDKAKRITGRYFRGAYGYILKPKGAQKLVDFVKEWGAFTADRTICENAVYLQCSVSSHVRLHPFFKNSETIKQFCTRTDNGKS
jgi:glycosyl transferase family 25